MGGIVMDDLDFNIHRNYLSDDIKARHIILGHICDYFDDYQVCVREGLPAVDIFRYVMNKMHGSVNVRLVASILKDLRDKDL